MSRRLILLVLLCSISCLNALRGLRTLRHPKHSSQKRLQLDVFGLGPAEVVVIAVAAAVLYGPGRLKEQLREKGIKGSAVSKGFKADREERVCTMLEYAERVRKQRTWVRINESIESGDPDTLDKLEKLGGEESDDP